MLVIEMKEERLEYKNIVLKPTNFYLAETVDENYRKKIIIYCVHHDLYVVYYDNGAITQIDHCDLVRDFRILADITNSLKISFKYKI